MSVISGQCEAAHPFRQMPTQSPVGGPPSTAPCHPLPRVPCLQPHQCPSVLPLPSRASSSPEGDGGGLMSPGVNLTVSRCWLCVSCCAGHFLNLTRIPRGGYLLQKEEQTPGTGSDFCSEVTQLSSGKLGFELPPSLTPSC